MPSIDATSAISMEVLRRANEAILSPRAALYLVGAWVAYRILVVLYNFSPLHPLYRFPGPRMAAATYAYEAYYDWILVGQYSNKIQRMHAKYGPVVRINPDELHCCDPFFAHEIYAGSGRVRDKWQHQLNVGSTGPVSASVLSTVSHEQHRLRRGALSRYFSRQQMLKLEDEVREFAELTVAKMLRFAGREPFNATEAFNCFTADVISQYAFGEPLGYVAQEDWEPNFATWTRPFISSSYMLRHNALARKLANVMPLLSEYMGEDVKMAMRLMNVTIPQYIQAALNNPINGRVFAALVESKTLPESEKTMYRLSGEGSLFLLAGTETTTAVLTVIIFYLLHQPEAYAKLMQDLQDIDPAHLKWTELEKRPYLWAVIHEALRHMPGIAHRSARIAREEDLFYRSRDGTTEWVIPRGSAIGMTARINHWDPEVFPNPDDFSPERWLVDGKPDYGLQRLLMSFGKGSRVCIGEHLAYCEIYLMTALLAFRVLPRARLHETTIENMRYDHDLVVCQSKKGAIAVNIAIS